MPIRRLLWRTLLGPIVGLFFGIVMSWLLIEILLRVMSPVLPPLYQNALFKIAWVPLSKRPELPAPLWRADDRYGAVIRRVNNFDAALFEGTKAARISTDNWLDSNSHVNFRVSSPGWQPRWPVDAIVVGDSFAFCNNDYEDCWVQILDSTYGLSVANLALAGTGSLSHLHVLQTFGPAHEPRFVIWQWWGNDFNDDYAQLYGKNSNPVVTQSKQPSLPQSPVLKALEKYSAAYALLKVVIPSLKPSPDYLKDPYRLNHDSISIRYGRPYLERAFDLGDQRNELGYEATVSELSEAKILLDQTSTPLVIVLIPTKEETYRDLTEPVLRQAWFSKISEGRLRLIALCQKQQMMCIDATETFQEHAKQGEQLYWPDDVHLNAWGNRILAEVVWKYLIEQGLANGQ